MWNWIQNLLTKWRYKKEKIENIPFFLEKYKIPIILNISNKGELSCQFEKSDKYTDEEITDEIKRIISEVIEEKD